MVCGLWITRKTLRLTISDSLGAQYFGNLVESSEAEREFVMGILVVDAHLRLRVS